MNDAPGMRGPRSRDENGQLREKRGDTLVKNIEKIYGVDFGVRGDMKLETLLKEMGKDSLHKLLHGDN